MTNEANIFYKPLRRVSFCENSQKEKENTASRQPSGTHIVSMMCDEPVKLSQTPRLKVSSIENQSILNATQIKLIDSSLFLLEMGFGR